MLISRNNDKLQTSNGPDRDPNGWTSVEIAGRTAYRIGHHGCI